MLAFLAKGQNHPTSDLQISALLPPLIGAMYLLVASTIHDLRAGYSLLVDGTLTGHRAFGFSLLVVYGLMVYATMTVLMSTSENNASVVLNAVAVLFVADLVSVATSGTGCCCCCCCFPAFTPVRNLESVVTQRCWSPRKI